MTAAMTMVAVTTMAAAMVELVPVPDPPERPTWRERVRAATGSARVRIVAVFLILLIAAGTVALVAVRAVLLARLDERIEAQLRQETDELQTLAREGMDPRDGEPFGTRVDRLFEVFLSRNIPDRNEAFLGYIREGNQFIRSVGQPRIPLHSDPDFTQMVATRAEPERDTWIADDGERVEYLALPLVADGEVRGVFSVFEFVTPQLAEVDEVTRVFAAVGAGVLVLAGSVLWSVAGRLLEPVRDVTTAAQAISAGDLGRRITVRGTDEVSQLAITFNAMLERLEEAFSSQQEFVNDAGHELRTPITIMRGHLDMLDQGLAEDGETVPILRDELARMSRFVEDLLVLAKARRPDFLHLEAVDVGVLTSELVAKAPTLAPRAWNCEAAGRGRIIADRQRLTQAVMQLAQNATQHTSTTDEITLGSEVARGEARFWVRDTGSGIPVDEQEYIFERFARGPNSRRADGAGLGLAIVRAIAEAHHGRIEVSSRPGQGSTFSLVLPVDQPEPPLFDQERPSL